MNFKSFVLDYVSSLNELLNKMDLEQFELFLKTLFSLKKDSTVYIIGNGGSAATASHMANDLAIGLKIRNILNINAISLCDNSAINFAIANDIGFENNFYFQLKDVLKEDDLLIAISCSGNSPNIIKAIEYAKQLNVKVIGLSGFDGGKLKNLSDIKIHFETKKGEYGLVEDAHSVVNHLLIDYLKKDKSERF